MKRITFLIIVIFLLVVIVNLSFSLLALWSKKDLLLQTQRTLAKEQKEHIALEKQLNQVQDPSFVEQEARDKLFLGKPGESIVLFPQATPSAGQKQAGLESKPAWLQWLELFF